MSDTYGTKLFRLAIALCLAAAPLLAQAAPTEDGAALEKRVHVEFTVMPSEWTVEQQPMDEIWQPLGLHGVNHYAYGKPVPPHTYAARSDPNSPLYQAWFGVYTVAGDSAFRLATGKDYAIESMKKLAEYDQQGWLAAMGDPHPLAKSDTVVTLQHIMIDGVDRTMCVFHMHTHSDLSDGETPLAKHMGMPGPHARRDQRPFHDVTLHGYYVFWYDKARNATIIVYAASSAFINPTGAGRTGSNPLYIDNGPALDKEFHDMIRGVHIIDASTAK